MSELAIFSGILVTSTLVSSLSQVMLKKSAQKNYPSKLKEYLNPLVIIAYGLFFGCTFLSMYALKIVPLSMSPILEASGYIFVAVLSFLFFREKLTKKQLLGMVMIIGGIVVYTFKL